VADFPAEEFRLDGEPAAIRASAGHWSTFGTQASDAAGQIRSLDTSLFVGPEGDQYRQGLKDSLPPHLDTTGSAYQSVATALGTYADALSRLQERMRPLAAKAPGLWQALQAAQGRVTSAHDADRTHDQAVRTAAATAPKNQPAPPDTYHSDSAAAATSLSHAQQAWNDNLTAARNVKTDLGTAIDTCCHTIHQAADTRFKHNPHGFGALVAGIKNFVKDHVADLAKLSSALKLVSGIAGVLALVPVIGEVAAPIALIAAGGALLIDASTKLATGKGSWGGLAFDAVTILPGGKLLRGAKAMLRGEKAVVGAERGIQAEKALAGGERALAGGERAGTTADRLALGDRARNGAPRDVCSTTGHPVDIATGKVFTDCTDLELPGPLPLRFERVWYSTSTYVGPLGHGWHHSYDAGLYATDDAVLYRTPDGRIVDLRPLDPGGEYYDRMERLTVARDEAGYRLRDSAGVTYRFVPLSNGHPEALVTYVLTDVVSRAGHRIALSYAGSRLTEIVDSGGRSVRFEHDRLGRITTMTAPHPDRPGERFPVARYDYDQLGNLVSMTDALGHVSTYAYRGHLLVRETDRTGLSFYFEYDGTDEYASCLRTWGDGGIYDHRLRYEPGLTTVVNSLGHATRYEHEDGLVVRRVDALGGEWLTRFEYRQPVEETDALGRVTTREYDHRGNEIRTVTPDGATVLATFDERDLPVAATDAVGGRWTWAYDDAGLLTERRDPLGRTWTFGYTDGLLTLMADPAGGVTRLRFDEQGSVAQCTAPDGGTVGWRRDALGRPVTVTDPLGNEQRRTYDLASRVVRVDEPDGNVRELSYDGEGNLLHALDRLYDVEFSYQGMGRLATRTQAGTTVRFEYDTEEQLTGIVNEHGHVYRFDYGPTGEVGAERGFDGVLRLYERDLLGRAVSTRRASGMVSRYSYDTADRVTMVEHSDGSVERFGYRVDGALMSADNGTGTVAFERDLLGRVTMEFQGPHWVASAYDALGLRVRMRSSLGADQTIERNIMGDVTAVSAEGFTARFTRDALGQELTRDLPGGVRGRWHRDRLGRPIRHEVRAVAGAVRDRTYTWEVDDRLRSVADALTGPIEYQHDALGQLASARYPDGRVELRMPDAVGNLFRTNDRADRTYGPAGQLLESTDDTGRRIRYTYDPEGNLTSKQASDGETWTYHWNAAGHLAQVIRPDGTVVSFSYDPLGRRISKTYRGQTTRWVWDGNVPLHEWVDGTLEPAPAPVGAPAEDGVAAQREALLSKFLLRGPPERGTTDSPITWLFEPETFAPLARLTADRQESMVTDHLGTPIALLDDTGTPTWNADLTTWGDLTLTTGESWHCPFRWPGQYEDPETGLHYNRFRYYDPDSGQYTSQDPIRLLGGSQFHSYVPSPATWTDPNGLTSCEERVEVFYRGMSNAEHDALKAAGGLAPRGESFVTQRLTYVQQLAARHPELYEKIVQFEMQPGTRDALIAAGARSPGKALEEAGLGRLPLIERGMKDVVHVKGELGAVNYGLRSGSVDIFNDRIISHGVLP
jgi:RHS repeat-associated protein